jgi:hypothetical protein
MPSKRQEYYKPIVIEIKPFDSDLSMKTAQAEAKKPESAATAEPVAQQNTTPAESATTTTNDDSVAQSSPMIEGVAIEDVAAEELPTADSGSLPTEVSGEALTLEWDNYQMDADDEESSDEPELLDSEQSESEVVETTTTLQVDNSATEDEFFETTM